MQATTYRTEPFPGWDVVRQNLRGLDAGKVLRWCVVHLWERRDRLDLDLHPQSFVPLVRACIRLTEDESLAVPDTITYTPAWEASVRSLLRQLASEAHIDFIDSPRLTLRSRKHADRRRYRAMWVHALQARHRSGHGFSQVGRVALHLREYWTEAHDRAKRREASRLPPPIESASESLEGHIALTLGLYASHGWHGNPASMFARTKLRDSFEVLLTPPYAKSASVAVGCWSDIERETRATLRNVFFEAPILRLGCGKLIAPDQDALFSALEARLIKRAGYDFYASERDGVLAGRTLKYSFEKLVGSLIEECSRHSGETYVPPFELRADGERTDSPDGHLVSPAGVTLFEAKGHRLDEPPDAHASLAGLHELMSAAAGATRRRAPLVQGTRFLNKWLVTHDPEAIARLGRPTAVQYVIGVPFAWPPCAHWPAFRKSEWRPHLGPDELDLDSATCFVDDHDLEVLAVVLKDLAARGTPSSAWALIREWRCAHKKGPSIRTLPNGHVQVLGGLGEYLATRYSPTSPGVAFIAEAAWNILRDAAGFIFDAEAVKVGEERLLRRLQEK